MTRKQEPFTLLAFVLLSTHVHVLYSTSEKNENFVMDRLHKNLKFLLEYSATQDILEEPNFSVQIQSYKHLLHTYKYIYRNPVEAGLVKKPEQFVFSTLPEVLGISSKNEIRLGAVDPVALIQNPIRTLNWLAEPEVSRLHH